jgi:hypothetical protein
MTGGPPWDEWIVTAFRDAMKAGRRTIRSVSVNTGIPYRSLQNYLAGKSRMPASVYLNLCNELAITNDYVIHRTFQLDHEPLTRALTATLGGTDQPGQLSRLVKTFNNELQRAETDRMLAFAEERERSGTVDPA